MVVWRVLILNTNWLPVTRRFHCLQSASGLLLVALHNSASFRANSLTASSVVSIAMPPLLLTVVEEESACHHRVNYIKTWLKFRLLRVRG
jgi:hypothetical protein